MRSAARASIPSCSTSNPHEPGFGKGGAKLKVDGSEVANQKIPQNIGYFRSGRDGVDQIDYNVEEAIVVNISRCSNGRHQSGVLSFANRNRFRLASAISKRDEDHAYSHHQGRRWNPLQRLAANPPKAPTLSREFEAAGGGPRRPDYFVRRR